MPPEWNSAPPLRVSPEPATLLINPPAPGGAPLTRPWRRAVLFCDNAGADAVGLLLFARQLLATAQAPSPPLPSAWRRPMVPISLATQFPAGRAHAPPPRSGAPGLSAGVCTQPLRTGLFPWYSDSFKGTVVIPPLPPTQPRSRRHSAVAAMPLRAWLFRCRKIAAGRPFSIPPRGLHSKPTHTRYPHTPTADLLCWLAQPDSPHTTTRPWISDWDRPPPQPARGPRPPGHPGWRHGWCSPRTPPPPSTTPSRGRSRGRQGNIPPPPEGIERRRAVGSVPQVERPTRAVEHRNVFQICIVFLSGVF